MLEQPTLQTQKSLRYRPQATIRSVFSRKQEKNDDSLSTISNQNRNNGNGTTDDDKTER